MRVVKIVLSMTIVLFISVNFVFSQAENTLTVEQIYTDIHPTGENAIG